MDMIIYTDGGCLNPNKIQAVYYRTKYACMSEFKAVGTVLIIAGVLLYLLLKKDSTACYPSRRDVTCYHDNPRPYRYYSTKTDYRVLVEDQKLNNVAEFVVPGCKAHALFLLQRHTTRYPDRDNIIEMGDGLPRVLSAIQDAFKDKKTHICPKDVERLGNWTPSFVPDDDNRISKSGEDVVFEQVRRFKKRFPTLFEKPYDPKDYTVGFTSRNRTLETAKAFLRELLTKEDYERAVNNLGGPQDALLQFHKECSKRQKKKKLANDKATEEVEKFEKGAYMKALLDTVSWRLGVSINRTSLKMITRACMFDYAILNDSPWCTALTEDDWKVLEFREDLDDYYKDGYGRELNYAQACPVVRELIYRLRNASEVPDQPTKMLYFSHAGGFKKVVARMGFLRDESPLRADQYCGQTSRKWRSSYMCPFNANLAFVLYKCSGAEDDVVATFLNEQLQQVPGCPSMHCPLKTFVSLYGNVAETCSFDDICGLE
ncbi:multiple inositol polyphosphate phosphatase 1-like isoform X2 [Ornithodoros turicata]|uniref:multiple inositol polyphosphate phosphatase 1-like isoform X2 n=1 Tax=Ornithodoros turicata TaxID=34597 RepID=UPI003139C6FD